MPSLYRRLLGPAFDTLPPTLQNLHNVETEWRGRANFRITRGQGWLRNFLAGCGGLPKAGENVPVRLRIVAEGDRERWIRQFGEHRFESVQWMWNGLLLESIGAVTLGFRLVVEPPALRLEPVRVWIMGVPWFPRLVPRAEGIEVGTADGCAIAVTVCAPLLGMLVRYEGLVVAE
jgi:hypothetical protein